MPEERTDSPAEIRLRQATERLKSAFGQYDKPPVERCVDMLNYAGNIPDEVRVAWGKSPWHYDSSDFNFIRLSFSRSDYFPLVGQLDGFEENARTTKYWLPRLLYGLSNGESDMVMEEWYIVERLAWAKWTDWPRHEVEAIHHWCSDWLSACIDWRGGNTVLHENSPSRYAPGCLGFTIEIGLDLTPVLDHDMSDLQPHVARAIHDIVLEFAPGVIRREQLDDRSDRKTLALRALSRWMLQPSTSERLEGAFFRIADGDRQLTHDISETCDWIENVRRSYTAGPRGLPNWLAEVSK